MKIVCAPDSFKECLSAMEVEQAMARGVRAAARELELDSIEIDECPLADGGEGTAEIIGHAFADSRLHTAHVSGPLGDRSSPIRAFWVEIPSISVEFGHAELRLEAPIAVIDLASAAGLTLVPESQRNPLHTTTFGLGELICETLERDCRMVVIALGGSATVDGACGALQALGMAFQLADGERLDSTTRPIVGGDLQHITAIDAAQLNDRLASARIVTACDVTNPLLGPKGAAPVFGPQKGATKTTEIEALERGLRALVNCAPEIDNEFAGAGAAGGAGFGLAAFANATIVSGIDLVLKLIDFQTRIADADLVLTGEGRLDTQTMEGKVISGVLRATAAIASPVPVAVVAGSIDASFDVESMMKRIGSAPSTHSRFRVCSLASVAEASHGSVPDTFRNASDLIAAASRRLVNEHFSGSGTR